MINLGIDVAKNSHVAAAISSEGEVLLTPFPFANSAGGFALLQEKLNSLPKQPLLIGLESTAHYTQGSASITSSSWICIVTEQQRRVFMA